MLYKALNCVNLSGLPGLAFGLIVFATIIFFIFPAIAICLFLLSVVIIALICVGKYLSGMAKIYGFIIIALGGLIVFLIL